MILIINKNKQYKIESAIQSMCKFKVIITPKDQKQSEEFAELTIKEMILPFIPSIGEKISFLRDPVECDEYNPPLTLGNIDMTIECIDSEGKAEHPQIIWNKILLNNVFEVKDAHHRPTGAYLYAVQV